MHNSLRFNLIHILNIHMLVLHTNERKSTRRSNFTINIYGCNDALVGHKFSENIAVEFII